MKGDSLEAVYRHHMNEIYHYLLRLSGHPQTAEDLLQDTFLRAYEYLDSYQGQKIRPWLFKVAHNIYVDWYRREKRQIQTDPGLMAQIYPLTDLGPESELLYKESFNLWMAAIRILPEKGRQVLLLRDYYEFSYQEIAEILNVSLVNVKVTLYRARQSVREVMKDEL